MASPIFIMQHWNMQLRVFLTSLGSLKKQYNSQSIHDLRVSVKKLRAYLKAVHLFKKAMDYKTEFKETDNLFKLLGKHRDLDVSIGMIKTFEKKKGVKLDFFSGVLQDRLHSLAGWLEPAIGQFDEKALLDLTSKVKDAFKDVSDTRFSIWVINNVARSYTKVAGRADRLDQKTHDIRKSLKDVLYQAELLPREKIRAHVPIPKIRKLLRHLGDWQDQEMLDQKVKHFRKDFIPSSRHEFDLLKQVEEDVEANKQELLKRCRKIFIQQ